jgi:hypothetical protein
MERSDLREYATDAIKFWEPWRIVYNLALAAIVLIYFALAYPLSKATVTIDFCLGLFLLAVIANVAYCAAYIVDIFAQASGFREVWRRYRRMLFVIGTLFAAIITRFVAMGMFAGNRSPNSTKGKSQIDFSTWLLFNAGNDLLSHTLSRAVQSALRGLTSVFGMGTGGSPAVRSPTT